ncbi:MAG: aminoglycoside phosphotransferase family protein [Actinobacteria bacterium]|nr:aminoglycoside phosphotransferase family protein [Actinomycetota bacterium]
MTSNASNALALIRARRALDAAGVPSHVRLEAVSSVTNEVWLTPELVVRINLRADQRLRREAIIAAALPAGIGYPEVVAQGGDLGSDWLILRRVPGRPLSRCWPGMTEDERRSAIDQLAARLRLLHATEAPESAPLHSTPQLLDAAGTGAEAVGRLLVAVEQARDLPHVDASVIEDVRGLVLDLAPSLTPFVATTLIHGDLTFENVLWDMSERRVTAVIDFEWSRAAPSDLDLDVLLRFAAYPQLHVPKEYEDVTKPGDYLDVPYWLAEAYPEIYDRPGQFARVRLYALAWDVQELVAHPPKRPLASLHPAHPWHRMVAMLRGTSHLDVLNGTAVPVAR